MLAYHGNPAIKRKYLARVAAHRKAEQLVQRVAAEGSGENFRGCAVGCTLDRYDHTGYPTELGIPVLLAHLEDRIFEGLAPKVAMTWPSRFLRAIPTGADLSLVWPRFAHWMLVDRKHGVIRHAKTEQSKAAIRDVAALFARQIKGGAVTREEWQRARNAVYAAASAAAADDAAAVYADAAAVYAVAEAVAGAEAVAEAAASASAAAEAAAAAEAVAGAEAEAVAEAAARQAHYAAMATKLEQLLREAA